MSHKQFNVRIPWAEVLAYAQITRHLRWGDTVVDVGAHVGQNTLLAAALVGPQGRVFAIEPVPDLLAQISKLCRLQKLTNVIPVPFAACGPDRLKNKEQYLYVRQNDDRPPMMNRFWFENQEQEQYTKIPVECHTVDQMTTSLPEAHLLKIDVEGCDVEVLKGSRLLIERSQNIAVLVECWPYGLEHNGSSLEEMLSLLESYGLKIYVLDEVRATPVLVNASMDLNFEIPHPDQPLSLANSPLQNLWCVRQCWEAQGEAPKPNTPETRSLQITWDIEIKAV